MKKCNDNDKMVNKRVPSVSTRLLSLVVKTSEHKLKIMTTPTLGPKNTVLFIDFKIAFTLNGNIVLFGLQNYVCF